MVTRTSLIWFFAFGGILLNANSEAQTDTLASYYAKSITESGLREHLTILASDAYQGRDTGREGQKMAAAYLREQFQRMGIPPVTADPPEQIEGGYYQPYQLIEERTGTISIPANDREYGLWSGLLYFNEMLKADTRILELVYLGDAKTLPTTDLQGKDVLIDGAGIAITETSLKDLSTRIDPIRKAGARVVLVSYPRLAGLTDQVHIPDGRMRLLEANGRENVPAKSTQVILMEPPVMDTLLRRTSMRKLARKRQGRRIPVDIQLVVRPAEERVTAENVLAFIEGSDKKDEVVVLTAHYDHIGVEKGVVYNGADDDGSGTVALLEMAEAFAMAKAAGHGPRRSVLIMPVSGEEKGLLGSRYYSEHPVFPLDRTVADLNIDMIGRIDSAHIGAAPYVYIIGSDRLSGQLHTINEEANKRVGLDLDYTFNAESDPNRFYYRSDHYNFARKGIPSIFYFSGVHEDYHQPGDDVDKIRFDLLLSRALLVFHTAWSIANREERLVLDKPVRP